MQKFKVGDKVRLLEDAGMSREPWGIGVKIANVAIWTFVVVFVFGGVLLAAWG